MKTKDFNKLLKRDNPKKILTNHMMGEIYLTDKQLDKVCKLNDGRGGCILKDRKKKVN